MKVLKFSLLGTSAVALSMSAAAFAQTAAASASPQVAEDDGTTIIVTAQRRAESVQSVPIAISVVGGDQLERQRINNLVDLNRTAASLQLSPNPGGSGGGGYIRGIGTFSRSRAAEPSVGIVVDGVVQGLTNISNLNDIERVEVLRGPQGTLFGQSVSAGVINITTRAPDPSQASGRFQLELSADDFAGSRAGRQLVRGSYNIPVAAASALRVTGYASRTHGILKNIYLDNSDDQKEYGVRGRFMAELGDVMTVNLIAEYSKDDTDGAVFGTYNRITPGSLSERLILACGVTPSVTNHEHCSDSPQIRQQETRGFSGQIDWEIGPVTLTSITAYRSLDSQTNNDIDRLPEILSTLNQASGLTTKYSQFTQELRLASDANKPLSFTVGGFYYDSEVINNQGPSAGAFQRVYQPRANIYLNPAQGIPTCFPVATLPACNTVVVNGTEQFQDVDSKNLSGFGELRYKSGPITFFAGGRITRSEVKQVGSNQRVLPTVGPLATSNVEFEDSFFSWRVGGQYEFSKNAMLYGSIARGYKSAQIAPIQGANPASIVFPEVPTDYQLGVKSNLFDGRLAFNVNGFYTQVKNYQTSFCNVGGGEVVCLPLNISKVTTKGVEMDMFGRIGRNLTINGTAIYNVIKYPAGFLADDGTNLGGQQLDQAPRFAATLSGDLTIPTNGAVEGFVSLELYYKGRTRLSTITAAEADHTSFKPHAILGARAGLRVDRQWSVALFANNIFNQESPQQFAELVNQRGDPARTSFSVLQTLRGRRMVGLQAMFEF